MAGKLEGRVAIVTGSGQGVGKGIAVGLAREGAKVVTNNRKPGSHREGIGPGLNEVDRQKLLALKGDAQTTVDQIIAEGGEAVPFFGDVSDFDTAGKMIETALEAFGRVDILINNAAGLNSATLVNTSVDDWQYATVAKLTGSFNCMRHAAPHMVEQKFGRIVNVASYAWMGLVGLFAYSAANAGLVGMTKAAAKELYRSGITVNAICPEAESPGHVREFSALKEKLGKSGMEIPEAKLKQISDAHGPAENLAPFVAYLATSEAAYISGAVFAVTGGGRVNFFSDPAMLRKCIDKPGEPWTVDELIGVVPEDLLKDYVSIAKFDEFATMLEDL